MSTDSRTLSWKIPWIEEPSTPQSTGHGFQSAHTTKVTSVCTHTYTLILKSAVHGDSKDQTRLKWPAYARTHTPSFWSPQSTGMQRIRHDWSDQRVHAHTHPHTAVHSPRGCKGSDTTEVTTVCSHTLSYWSSHPQRCKASDMTEVASMCAHTHTLIWKCAVHGDAKDQTRLKWPVCARTHPHTEVCSPQVYKESETTQVTRVCTHTVSY